MKKTIDVSKEVREGIRKTFRVSDRAIWFALAFDPKRGMSDKAKRIRQYAKINGGVEMVVAEKNDTLLFDHEGSFRQYFTNGVVLEFDKKLGDATLFWKGEEMVSFEDVKVREMELLQNIAEKWRQKDTDQMKEEGYKEKFVRGVKRVFAKDTINYPDISNYRNNIRNIKQII